MEENDACQNNFFPMLKCKAGLQTNLSGKSQRRCSIRRFIKKEALAHVLSFEFCETSKSPFFTEHLRVTASVKAEVRINLPQ